MTNGARKIQGLGNFCSDLEISFSCVSLRLGFSYFWPRGLGVSDFYFLANGFDQNHDKIVNLIKNVR